MGDKARRKYTDWDAKRIAKFKRLWNGWQSYARMSKAVGVAVGSLRQTASTLRKRGVELVKRYPLGHARDRVLDEWAAGKLAKEIAFDAGGGLTERAVVMRVSKARRAGDPRAVYRKQSRAVVRGDAPARVAGGDGMTAPIPAGLPIAVAPSHGHNMQESD